MTCIAAAVLSAGAILLWQTTHRSALDFFWRPVLETKDPVLLCIADQLQYSSIVLRDASVPARQVTLSDKLTAIVIDDVYATIKVAGILQSSGKQYSLKGEGATNLADLRNGPTVFVGAFDNAWTLRMTNQLRYHFANDGQMTKMTIVDRTAPSQTQWVLDRSCPVGHQQLPGLRNHCALQANSDTGKLAVVVAGIGRGGTIAAGEFLTDRQQTSLSRSAQSSRPPADKKNMEVVLSTQIIDGEPGSPKDGSCLLLVGRTASSAWWIINVRLRSSRTAEFRITSCSAVIRRGSCATRVRGVSRIDQFAFVWEQLRTYR